MRAAPLMLAIALGLGLAPDVDARSAATAETDGARRAWIVVFEEAPAATFRGFDDRGADVRRPKLAPTSPKATGADRYDARSEAAREYVGWLADLRRIRLAEMSARIGRDLQPRHSYEHATYGVSLELTAKEAAAIAAVPGVRLVSPEFRRRLMTESSPGWIGAPALWNGTVPGVGSHRGEGVVVGVIDTGINRTHVAFSGAGIANPKPGYLGWCTVNASACNGKLIGLWDFIGAPTDGRADPVDGNGHGTHVAGTAAGNPFMVGGATYSGVAPRANVVMYKACPDDTCDASALIDAIDQAVADGVDVINYSIGGGSRDPWLGVPFASYYDDSEAFLAAREAGIVVAAAAGNDGPTPGSLSAPSNSPWVMSVANANRTSAGADPNDYTDDGFTTAASSGRGPVVPFGIVKPDVTAPGTAITAAGITGSTSLATKTGTSMATPHVAGAAALLKSANPALTADQLISALTLSARNNVRVHALQVADGHEQGAGIIDIAKAARAGLYLEMPAGALRDARANPFDGASEALNLPTLGDGACFRTCTMTRTFRLMPGAAAAGYTVAATSVTPGATITASTTSFTSSAAGTPISVTVNVDNTALVDTWAYGWLTLTNTSGDGRPDLSLPIAVYATPFASSASESALSAVEHVATAERGFFDVEVDGMVDLPDARFATSVLAVPTRTTQNIAVDPTNGDPYDNGIGTFVRTIALPATATATTYRIDATTSAANPDIDLYVGRDADGDSLPDASEELCVSGSPGSDEACSIEVSAGGAGATIWVMAQNWSGPGTGVTLETVALPMAIADVPELTVTGPGHVPAGTPFSIRVAYDDPTLLDGERRVGLLYTQRTPGATMVTTPFTITRSGAAAAAFALSPGVARTVKLAPGTAHERLFVDIPPNATQATFRTTNGSGSVSLYLARTTIPGGPVVAAAPARNAPGVRVANAAGANQTITLSGADLQPGRWYLTPVNTGGAAATVDVVATIDSVGDVPDLVRGSYYNPTRGGHGIFVYPSGGQHALLWYTYLQDGTPTWYYAQAAQPGANQVWSAPVYRAAWNGSTRTLDPIGNVVLTPSSATTLTFSYNIDGFTGSETMDTFLTGCPAHAGQPLDVSAHWYEDGADGYGYSVQVNPSYEFLATFVFDGIGVPRFLVAERPGTFDAATPSLPLAQLGGFAPLGAHFTPSRTTVGQLERTYGAATIETIGTSATFVNGVPGTWARSGAMTRLSTFPQGCQ